MVRTLSAEKRRLLLSAGEAAFAAHGVGAATVEEIARAAGVAKGTFYLYFRSKDDLVAALRDRFADELVAALSARAAANAETDWLGLARRQLDAAADAYLAHRSLLAAIAQPEPTAGQTNAAASWPSKVTEPLAAFIEAGASAGAFSVEDPELTASLLFHAVDGLFHDALGRPGEPDRRRLLAAAWQMVSRTLLWSG